ncbi:hypothetical protein D3C85_887210 [compost metagenome]
MPMPFSSPRSALSSPRLPSPEPTSIVARVLMPSAPAPMATLVMRIRSRSSLNVPTSPIPAITTPPAPIRPAPGT